MFAQRGSVKHIKRMSPWFGPWMSPKLWLQAQVPKLQEAVAILASSPAFILASSPEPSGRSISATPGDVFFVLGCLVEGNRQHNEWCCCCCGEYHSVPNCVCLASAYTNPHPSAQLCGMRSKLQHRTPWQRDFPLERRRLVLEFDLCAEHWCIVILFRMNGGKAQTIWNMTFSHNINNIQCCRL